MLGRPFLISKQEALLCFDDWERKFVPTILRTISKNNLQIQPVLLPFYGDGKQVYYGGSQEYALSDMLVSAAKSDPQTWIPFDEQILKTPDISVVSRWAAPSKDLFPKHDNVKQALLPAYLVRFLHTNKSVSTAIVGGESGRVSALREHTVTSAKQEFQRAIRIQSNLVFLFPPMFAALLVWALVRIRYSHKIAKRLSSIHPTKYASLLANDFCVLDKLTAEERQRLREQSEEQAYQRQAQRDEHQERLHDMLSGGADNALEILGLRRGATQDEIRSAYRTALLKYHPDHFQGPSEEATRRTQQVIKAYRLLSK